MAVAFQTSSFNESGASSSSTITATMPAGVTTGDLLVIIAYSDSSAATPEFSDNVTGYTFEGEAGDASTDMHVGVYTKIAGASESSATISINTVSYWGAITLRIDGHHATTYSDTLTFTEQTTGTSAYDVTGIDPTADNALVIASLCADGQDVGTFTLDTANGWTGTDLIIADEFGDTGSPTAGGAFAVSERIVASGASGLAEHTRGAAQSETFVGFQFAIAPAASASVAPIVHHRKLLGMQ